MSSTRFSRKRTRRLLGLTTAPESECEPGCLPFSSTATGTSPSRSARSGVSAISCPSRIAHARPAGPAPAIRIPTSKPPSRRAARSAERLGELLDEREVLRAAEPAPAGHDHVRVFDRRAFGLLVRLLDHRRLGREVLERRRELLDLGLAAGLGRVERARAEKC